MNDAFELEVCQGKYRYRYEAGKQEVWRNGEPWEVMNGRLIGDKFVFSLAVELDEALKERDALRAKITEMERQELVGTTHAMPGASAFTMACFNASDVPVGTKLYALPGAKGEWK